MNQFADRPDAAVAEHIDIIDAADAVHHVQLIAVKGIHVGNRDGFLLIDRVNRHDLNRIAAVGRSGNQNRLNRSSD